MFQKKWQIALDEIDRLLADGVPRAPVVMDAGYGTVTELRDELVARDLIYVAGVQSEVTVWPEGEMPAAPKTYSGLGRPPTLLRRLPDAQPVSLVDLALRLPKSAWRSIRWRSGTKGDMRSRFARVRVRAAHRDYWRKEPRSEEWLLIEWPTGRPSTGCRTSQQKRPSPTSCISPRSVGGSNATTRSSRTKSASTIMKAAAGPAFTTMEPYASPPTRSWQPSELGFPPQRLWPSSKPLQYPEVSDHGEVPLRPERHNPASIASLRRLIARMLARHLGCCHACGATHVY